MPLRSWIKRLEHAALGGLASFELVDGSRYYYDRLEAAKETFLHGMDCMTADGFEDWPEPPEAYLKMCEARDPAAVVEMLTSAEVVEFPYDRGALISERRLVPVEYGPVEDLSEP
jgi:hypothetical protein